MANFLEQLRWAALKKDTVPHPLSGTEVTLREVYLLEQLALRTTMDGAATAEALAADTSFKALSIALKLPDTTLSDLASDVLEMDDDAKMEALNQLVELQDTPVKKLLFLGDMVRTRGAQGALKAEFLEIWEFVAALLQVKGEARRQARAFCEGLAVGERKTVSAMPQELVAYYFDDKPFTAQDAPADTLSGRSSQRVSGGSPVTFTLPSGVELEMNWVEPGAFDRDGHRVTLTRGFWLGKYQFTQKQWNAVGVQKVKACNWSGDQLPVEYVRWDEAMACCRKLNELLREQLPQGYAFTLPTEAQWEFAARGGVASKGYKYSGSNNLDEVGWYKKNSGDKTHPVGQKQPNELDFYDMSGNVCEWCSDWSGDSPSEDVTDPTGLQIGSSRVNRGGSWHFRGSSCACAYRNCYIWCACRTNLGFRVALSSLASAQRTSGCPH